MRDLKIEMRHTQRKEDSLYRYLNELSTSPPLKPEEEVLLAKQIREGDERALDRLIRANLKFVVSVAKKYAHIGLPLNDLINEGNIGLIKAARSYDETKGFKFISYAVWYIRAAIFTAFGEQLRMIRIPMNQIKAIAELKSKEDILMQNLHREPTLEEIAELANIKLETLILSNRYDKPVSSIDACINEEYQAALWSITKDENAKDPEQDINIENLKLEINRLLSTLPRKEREVVKATYGLGEEYPLDFEQIGPKYGKTPTWARQLNRQAISRLQKAARPDLVEYLC
ncbi:RNA polymerase sigma factor RpoD/SigA [Pedobacter aquatilis]|uniref:sigma-70 family RNA polymerase sigma factor n=1 Tax=Pedobacter aquatilis TaxID=351343 RepID=UPI00292DAD13|nr:RNA polymerase sigma factor RpoD/SigA [Pedobacter aquatilis]